MSHPRLALLAILPISQRIGSDESQCSSESTRFNAESYIQFLNETFDVYSSSFEEWCLTLIGDNVSSNLRVPRMTGKPHISRASHRLNLEVKSMIENHADLSNAITSVRVTMREVKPKLKSSAELRNLIDLSPVIDNETMWSGKVKVLRRFQEIPEELIEAHEHPDADFTINTSLSFAGKCEKYRRMLAELYIVTNMLQTRGRTLAECERDLDTLIDAVNEERSNRSFYFLKCRLKDKYISIQSGSDKSAAFTRGVIKIQNNQVACLTKDEKKSVEIVRRNHSSDEETDANGAVQSLATRLAKRRKLNKVVETHIDCRFLVGSAAEIERVCSIGGNF